MEAISALDIFKIGIGPSSSHTLGPWRAASLFAFGMTDPVSAIRVHLYGSLAKTGKGHGTDLAVQLGLMGLDPVCFESKDLHPTIQEIASTKRITLGSGQSVNFDPTTDIVFHRAESLPEHPNGIRLEAETDQGTVERIFFSVGGGFVVEKGVKAQSGTDIPVRHPFANSAELAKQCHETGLSIAELALENEEAFRDRKSTIAALDRIYQTMLHCIHEGCSTDGILPGGLMVTRRAAEMSRKLTRSSEFHELEEWIYRVRSTSGEFETAVRWVSCFALAVNEVNAAFGRVVTAPTNGAAGVVPAVLMYHQIFGDGTPRDAREFLLTAAQVGIVFKRNATISAALGGCQAEIGVSSAMAAAGYCHVRGGSTDQVLMAAEIAMEHHLGLTCDPIGGLVQIPCIERNSMGAMKAITAARIALDSDPSKARVTLDDVVHTMWKTALDMNNKYKETSEGGLAIQIPVNVSEC